MVITESIIKDNYLKVSVFIPDDFKDHIARLEYEIIDFEYTIGGLTQNYTLENNSIINGKLYHTHTMNKGNYEGKHAIIDDDKGANEILPGKIVTLEWNVLEIINEYDQYISGKIKFLITSKNPPPFSTKSETVDFRIRIYKKYTPPNPTPDPDPKPKSSKMVFYIPEGIPNIKNLFKNIDFSKVSSWKIIAHDQYNNILATSRNNIISHCEQIRIHFINSLGELDSINFGKVEITQETKSDTWTNSQRFPFDRTKGGAYRNNITSNEVYEAETKRYTEDQQYWLKEFANSSKAWIEMPLPNGFLPSDEKQYIPILISNGNVEELKSKNRYEYIVRIKFSMSNANITHR